MGSRSQNRILPYEPGSNIQAFTEFILNLIYF